MRVLLMALLTLAATWTAPAHAMSPCVPHNGNELRCLIRMEATGAVVAPPRAVVGSFFPQWEEVPGATMQAHVWTSVCGLPGQNLGFIAIYPRNREWEIARRVYPDQIAARCVEVFITQCRQGAEPRPCSALVRVGHVSLR